MIEITPINDEKEHTSGTTCDCCPRLIMESGEMIVVHNAYDNREIVEKFYEVLNEKSANNGQKK